MTERRPKAIERGVNFVVAPLRGRKVLIVDDVETAGTAEREAIDKIRNGGGILVGIIVALDQMEKLPALDGNDGLPIPSATGDIRKYTRFLYCLYLTLTTSPGA